MDLNQLLFHHQRSLIRAASQSATSALGALRLVKHYQTRIDRLRHDLGVADYPEWCSASGPAGPLS